MALAGKIGIGVTLSALCSGLIVFGPLDLAAAHRGASVAPALFERQACGARSGPTSSTSPAIGETQSLTVSLPSTALLRVDHGGHVVSAMTNTGCAPRPDDDIFYVRPDGSVVPAPSAALANRRWVGNFTNPGVYVSQP